MSVESWPSGRDPFAATCDPSAYVPREASEEALGALDRGFRRGERMLVLSGPPGIGKTLLLQVLAARLSDAFRCLYLPYASMPWPEMAGWVLGLLGEPERAVPDRALLAAARARAERGRPLLLLIDEASGLPAESADGLRELVEEADGALRLLLVPVDDARAGRVLARFPGAIEHRLSAPLTREETSDYVAARLEGALAPAEARSLFDPGTLAAIHQGAGGIPMEIHRLAAEVLRGNLDALPGEEARRELGDPRSDDAYALEVDFEGNEVATPAPEEPPVPRESPAAAPPAREPETAAEAHGDAPLGPPEPESASLLWIVSVNFAIAAFVFGLLWFFGYIPPP